MLLNFYNTFRPDKTIEHPILGEISCSGYLDAFKKCQEIVSNSPTKYSIQCYNLHEISMNCYKFETNQDFLNWINGKLEERKKLNQFLNENGSIQPKLQSRNMFYDVFIQNAEQRPDSINNSENEEQIQKYFKEQMMKNKGFFDPDIDDQ
ncbi:hypothetical protein ABPG72_010224 [Tetrahymena utriculariae]